MSKLSVAILADVPLGTITGLKGFASPRSHYATWLEALIPEFGNLEELDIHWITFSKEISKTTHQRALGQNFTVFPRFKKIISILSRYHWETRRVAKFIRGLGPDVIHSWGCEDVYGIAGGRLSHPAKVFTLQGCLSDCLKTEPDPKILMKLQASLEEKTIKAFEYGTGESEISTGHLKRIFPQMKTSVIDYGVAPDFFDAKWCPAQRPTILFAGTVCTPKGIEELFAVMRLASFTEVTLELAGDGVLIDELKSRAMPNVKFLGRLTRLDLIGAMERAWVLAIPTHADTGPSVVKEARVVGLPIVTTDVAGAAHYVSTSKAGHVIPVNDVSSLANALEDLIQSRERCQDIGKRGWQDHRRIFRPLSAVKKFAELYRRLASKPMAL